ncbi:type VI secretion system tip protein VgrG, partial [Burkholderia cepacia]
LKQRVAGRAELEAGQAIRHRTKVYEIRATGVLEVKGPGGTVRIDNGGITLEGVAIRTKRPMTQQSGGASNPFAITGAPASGKPLDRRCGRRPDGTCPLADCTCLGGRAK